MDHEFRLLDMRRAFRYRAMRGALLTPLFGRWWAHEPLDDEMQRARSSSLR